MRDEAGKGLVAMNTYHAVATRDGKYWLVHVPELGQYTQARTLAEVEPMARELISLVLEVPADSFQVEQQNKLSESVWHHLELARKYAGEAAWYQAEAASERRFAAREMRAEGMTVREIGDALGISHQRAQQLISQRHPREVPSRRYDVTQVEWSELEAPQAETLLSVLLYNEHPKATRIRPSRGDFGIDVLVPNNSAPETFDVYQIKYFSKSLTASQRGQVEQSFRRLLIGLVRRAISVADWYLVIPVDNTLDTQMDWFNSMPAKVIEEIFDDDKFVQLEKKQAPLTANEKEKITAWRNAPSRLIKWEGRPLCMSLAAKYPFVVDYYLHGGQQHIIDAFKDLASVLATDKSLPDPSTADSGTAALVTPAQLQDHLFKVQKVLDTDPHFKYGISLDPAPPAILDEDSLVAASQVTQPDGRSVTVRIYQRFDEALRERPIPINVTFLASHGTFDQDAFDMWRKYGMPLIAAPAEVETSLPGGLGEMMSGGITQVTIGTVGHTYEARFRIRRPDGNTGPELLFTLTASTGHEGTGIWETGTETTGLLTFESLTDLETKQGSWGFKQDSIVGKEVVKALPTIEFRQDLCTPNVLQVAQQYGPFKDYHDIPEALPVFPESVMDFLRALAAIQTATATPIVIPDLTTITAGIARAVAEAAALVSGQTLVGTWDRMAMARDTSLDKAGPEQNIDFASEYQLLVYEQLVVNVGEQKLALGTVAKLAFSARYEVEDGEVVVARPYRNDTLQTWYSPIPDAAGSLDRRVLGRVIGHIDDFRGLGHLNSVTSPS
jgi:predicted RNase H-like HicB family nuclease